MSRSPLRLTFADVPRDAAAPFTLRERAAAYLRAFPQCADAVWVAGGNRWLYGIWQIGQDYRNASRYYGAYPHGYLKRVGALFPDICAHDTLHAFSGSLPAGEYTRLDLNPELQPELVGSVYDVATLTPRRFGLVCADPAYTPKDSEKYGTPALNRGRATRALADVTRPGGFLMWLDTTWPMHRKADWHYFGQIALVRSTNHRIRSVTLFQRKASA